MTEQWKITAAERFNDRIRMTPSDLFWPQTPPPEPEPTLLDETRRLAAAHRNLFKVVVDNLVLGRVA